MHCILNSTIEWEPAVPGWAREPGVLQEIQSCCTDNLHQYKKLASNTKMKRYMESSFQADMLAGFIYDSNEFEDAGLDKVETRNVVLSLHNSMVSLEEKAKHLGNKSIQHLEVVNHYMTVNQAFSSIQHPLTVQSLLQLHKTLMNGLDNTAGQIRNEEVHAGDGHSYPSAYLVPETLTTILNQFNNLYSRTDVSMYTKAAFLKFKFVQLHPFMDGNGRLSRILMNWVLHLQGLPFVVSITNNGHKKAKGHYMQALKNADKNRAKGHVAFLIQYCTRNNWKLFQSKVEKSTPEDNEIDELFISKAI
ncbi:protein adenylyltransferase Fic-like [Branchiostoma floridae]|uniref:Protein adenylyltransferase Fic-like n=1 Tax=Branchiostoma floridae TaxID=7739 RepID=A0A9J7MP26_BRAFL|nr:protein adenylyltransferase Fic-like [Branchiostoma floridae]XP_035675241.1 protein adenylyltransferase Fic-like [Branchiostoma floridae]XP_035675242.1 protein adenylyltransferase Fic-like [Branchiostoma floridae]